jgi:guanylate kinase
MNLGNVALVKEQLPTSVCVLVDAPINTIQRRLRSRGVNTEEQIAERLCNAKLAKKIAEHYDFVLFNDDGPLEEAYAKLKSFLIGRLGATTVC